MAARRLRLGVAVTRGLLIDLLAGEDPSEVDAAHDLFVRLAGQAPQALPAPSGKSGR